MLSSMRPLAFMLPNHAPMLPPQSPSRFRTVSAALSVIATAASLSACGPDLPNFAPVCPRTAILSDGADLTQFRAAGTDLTDMVVDGRITGLNGKCSLDDLTHLRTVLNVNLEVTRGPAAQARQQLVTYFVSVSRGDTILAKQDYRLNVAFPRNSDRLRLTGEQIDLVVPVDDTLTGAAYSILVGFQLTPEQLAFNRRRGPR